MVQATTQSEAQEAALAEAKAAAAEAILKASAIIPVKIAGSDVVI